MSKKFHLNATKNDWRLSSWVLSKLPSADQRTPGHITPEERRRIAINARADIPFLSVKTFVVDLLNCRLYSLIQRPK